MIINDNIRNLLFDLGGVIMDIKRENCVAAFEQLGFADVDRYLNDYEQRGFFRDIEAGQITPEQFYAEVHEHVPASVTDAQIAEAFNKFLVGIPENRLYLLRRLREHHRVYMLSNTNPIMWEGKIRSEFAKLGHDVSYYFDGTVTSFEAGVCKPDPRIFEFTVKKLGINPADTLFFDDSQANCDAAAALGFHTAHVTTDEGLLEWLS